MESEAKAGFSWLPGTGSGRWRLSLFIVLIISGLAVWQTAVWTRSVSLESLQENSHRQLNRYISHLQGHLEKYESLPELLATNKRLVYLLQNPADRERIEALNRYLETINSISDTSDTYLMDGEGLTIAASNWQSEKPFVGRNFSYRPYFQEAMKGHLGRYFALGSTSNRRGYYFAYPVRHQNRILGAVVIKIDITAVEQSWDSKLDEFIVTDPDGVIFITSKPEWRFRSFGLLSDDTRQRIEKSLRYPGAKLDPVTTTEMEILSDDTRLIRVKEPGSQGRPTETTYLMQDRTMPEAGWRVHILTHLTPVKKSVLNAVLLAAFLCISLVLLLLFLRQQLKRRQEKAMYEQQAHKALETSEARIRGIIENTGAGLIMMDEQCLIESLNPTAQQLFGYDRAEILGRRLTDLVAPTNRGMCTEQVGIPNPSNTVIEIQGLRKNNQQFPIEMSINSVHLHGGTKLLATIHDISERKQQEEALQQARDELEIRVRERTTDLTQTNIRLIREIEEHRHTEEALRQTQDELIQAAKMAAVGQMSTSISHELNQPLAAIRSYADNTLALLAQERVGDAQWNLKQISDLTERMAQIGSRLKLFARKTSGQLTSVSVPAVINAALEILNPKIEKNRADIRLELPEEELYVLGDTVQFQQVLVNLLDNALHAVSDEPNPHIIVHATEQNDSIILSVSDSGPGISEQDLPHIFDPFYTTKKAGEGLGLGLSISYRIVDSLNGQLNAANHQNGGAVFTLKLPKTSGSGNLRDHAKPM